MTIVYALVSVGQNVLAECTAPSGTFWRKSLGCAKPRVDGSLFGVLRRPMFLLDTRKSWFVTICLFVRMMYKVLASVSPIAEFHVATSLHVLF